MRETYKVEIKPIEISSLSAPEATLVGCLVRAFNDGTQIKSFGGFGTNKKELVNRVLKSI